MLSTETIRGNSQICHDGVILLVFHPLFARPKGCDAIIDSTDALAEAPVNHHEVVDDAVVTAAVDGALRASGFVPEVAEVVQKVEAVFVNVGGIVSIVIIVGVVVPQQHVANAALVAERH